jgi:hypothetical protein
MPKVALLTLISVSVVATVVVVVVVVADLQWYLRWCKN